MHVKRCFSFSDTNNSVQLVDARGCADNAIISDFKYDKVKGFADATIVSMFKFPESSRVHFQCDIIVCRREEMTHILPITLFMFRDLQAEFVRGELRRTQRRPLVE